MSARIVLVTAACLGVLSVPQPVGAGVPCLQEQERPGAGPEPAVARLVQSCRKCHEDVHDEWGSSRHAKAWTDPVFQAALAGREDQGESCARCHAPRSILETGPGNLPRARSRDRALGVNCVTCHIKGTSEYHGPYDSRGHGGVVADPRYFQAVLCLSCHGQPEARREHDQGTTWRTSGRPEEGATCQSCHMPPVLREMVTRESIREKYLQGVVPCRTHVFTGARSGRLVAHCAQIDMAFGPGGLEVGVRARTGHALPVSSNRRVVLEVIQSDEKHVELQRDTRTYTFPDGPFLVAGERTVVTLEAADGAVRAEARLRQELVAVPGRKESIVQPITRASVER